MYRFAKICFLNGAVALAMSACGGGDTETIRITSPVFVPDQQSTVLEDNSITLSLSQLLSGADTLFITSPPANGSLSGSVSALTYTPDRDFHGSDVAIVRLRAGRVDSVPFELRFEVTQVDDAPRQANHSPSYTVSGFNYANFDLSIENPDNLPLSATATNLPAWATIDVGTRRIVGNPTNADVGVYPDIRVTVSNSAGSFTTDPFAIEVVFEKDVSFLLDSATSEFLNPEDYLTRFAVDGTNILMIVRGRDTQGRRRVSARYFDPIAGETIWQQMLPDERNTYSIVRVRTEDLLLTTRTPDGSVIINGMDRDGNILWEVTPDPLAAGSTTVKDLDYLSDGRVVMLVVQSTRNDTDPELCEIGFYRPEDGTLTQQPFDSGVPDSQCPLTIRSATSGGFWVAGGAYGFGDIPLQAWVRKYDENDLEEFQTVIPNGGELATIATTPRSNDLFISGGSLIEWWIGRLNEFGDYEIRHYLDTDTGQVHEIAVQPDGRYSAISGSGAYQVWSADDVLLSRSRIPYARQLKVHPSYDVLTLVETRLESRPLPEATP